MPAPTRAPVTFVTRFPGEAHGGLGRYEQSLLPELERLGPVERRLAAPWPVPRPVTAAVGRLGIDLASILRGNPAFVAGARPAGIVHFANQHLAASLLWQRQRGPTVVTVHDIIPRIAPGRPWFTERQGLVEKALIRQWSTGLKRADRLIAVSTATRDDLVRHLGIAPDRIRVVPQGLDHDTFRGEGGSTDEASLLAALPAPVAPPFVLYVGSHHLRKNLGTLVRAVASARRRVPALTLVLAGAARGTAPAATLGGDDFAVLAAAGAVTVVGHVPIGTLTALYRRAAAAVLPSWYEGFGLPVLEAMACGCPTISAATSSLPEVVGEAGLLFDPASADELARQIVRLVEDGSLAASLRERGLARAAGFTWRRTATETAAVYAELADTITLGGGRGMGRA